MTTMHQPSTLIALKDLVTIIEVAGLSNLAKAVRVDQATWFLRAWDALSAAKAVIAREEGRAR
jgi:hypothetical protein